jgi:cytochrome c peroxidase
MVIARRLATRRRPSVRTFSIFLLAGAGLAAVAAVRAQAPASAPARPAFTLPATPANYAHPELPPHFAADLVRRCDNTPADNPLTDAGATLGRVLFYDTRLSADGSLSCASCHRQENAFADRGRVSVGVGGRRGDRNSMSLVNARYHESGRFFWDERAATLEEQVLAPIADRNEMAHDVEAAVAAVKGDPAYAPLFGAAFGDEAVTRDRVAKALAQFVRALVSARSKLDAGLVQAEGDLAADFPSFSAEENRGKAIFLGEHDLASRGNCATCHLRNYAFWQRTDRAQQAALFMPDRLLNNGLDAAMVTRDNGAGDHTLAPADYGRFKVPDLRNVEVTGPYMHDGRFATLEEVVAFYNADVQPHPNLDPQLRAGRPGGGTVRPRLMDLDADDQAALVAFLKTLTDRAFLSDPKFGDPFRR